MVGRDLNSSLLALEVMQSRELSVILLLNMQFHKFKEKRPGAGCLDQMRDRSTVPVASEDPHCRAKWPNKTEMLWVGRGQGFNRRQSSSTFRVRQGMPDTQAGQRNSLRPQVQKMLQIHGPRCLLTPQPIRHRDQLGIASSQPHSLFLLF